MSGINSNATGLFGSSVAGGTVISQPGINWTLRAASVENTRWVSVCYGNGLFVAVGAGNNGERVMTSVDGINWNTRTEAAFQTWRQVCYGNGLFVAIADNVADANRFMYSSDGITWALSPSGGTGINSQAVCYGNGLFVAVGYGGANRVLTSSDGLYWTSRTLAAEFNLVWERVSYGNGLFVAVAATGTGSRVMTSPDGITWTLRNTPADYNWYGIVYGNGLFVAVANSGGDGTDRIMTSPDGITWTLRTSPIANWYNICYGEGLFAAIANNGPSYRIMTSPDGITWTLRETTTLGGWTGICYGNGIFVATDAVNPAVVNRVMTSGVMSADLGTPNNSEQGGRTIYGGLNIAASGSKLATGGGNLKEFFANAGNVGSGETDLYSYTVEANVFSANGQTMNAEFDGSYDGGNNLQIKAYFAGSVIFDSTNLAITNDSTWSMKVRIIRVSATVVRCSVDFIVPDSTPPVRNNYIELTGLTLTGTNILKITGQSSGGVTDGIIAKMGSVTWLPASV